jgi:hypothetical protein
LHHAIFEKVVLMKKEILLAVIAVSIISGFVIPCTRAAPTYTAGVSANQVATYSYTGTMSYNSPTLIHIRSVSGSIVNYRRDSATTDIAFDVSNVIVHSPWWFVSEGMVVSDQFQSGNPNYLASAVVSKSYAGQSWSAVQLNSSVGGVVINALFDQDTGLMLYYHQHDGGSYSNTFVITALTIETEVPATPIDPAWIIVMAIAGIGISILLASRKMAIRSANE